MVSGKLVLVAAAVFGGTALSVQQFWCGCESNQEHAHRVSNCGEVSQGRALLPLHESSMPEPSLQARKIRAELPLGVSVHGTRSQTKVLRTEFKASERKAVRPVSAGGGGKPGTLRTPADANGTTGASHPAAIRVFESSY